MAFQPVSPLRPWRHRHPHLSKATSFLPPNTLLSPIPVRPRTTTQPLTLSVRPLPPPSSDSPANPSTSTNVHLVATARAITPMRRPSRSSEFDESSATYTEQPLPSQRRSDLMAPKRMGPWALVPYFAVSTVLVAMAWLGKRRFAARQEALVAEYGDVVVMYGTTPDSAREITSEYKRKLGPGILRGAMFASFLRCLVAERSIVPSIMEDVRVIKALLRLSDDKSVRVINELATTMQDSPSLLGKLLFIAERIVSPDALQKLDVIPLFPYSPTTVADLQRNMLERCYRDYVNQEIDVNHVEEPPMAAAAALRMDAADAKALFDGVVLTRIKKREKEAAEAAAAEAEEASKPDIGELDYPARSGEPAKAAVHAYQCSDCGYTLFPAAGREFKFYGDDFVCPACGAPKDKFVDLNSDK